MTSKDQSKIYQKIEQKQYYDAYSLTTAMARRYMQKKLEDEAQTLCSSVAGEFIKTQQYSLAFGLAQLNLELWKKIKSPATNVRVEAMLKLFESAPACKCEERFVFMESLIQWISTEHSKHATLTVLQKRLAQRVHEIAGDAYREVGEYGLAQAHLLKSLNLQKILQLIQQWREHVYPSERDLLVLRIILGLMKEGNHSFAADVLHAPGLGLCLDSKDLPPPLQCSYLLFEACKVKNHDFFNLVCRKYYLVLRKDPALKSLAEAVEKRYFGPPRNREFNLSNLMTQLLSAS